MRTGRPIAPLSLGVEERETLEGWARRPKSAQALAQRSRIVLECASGSPNTRRLRTSSQVVAAIVSNLTGALRRRFGRTGASRSATPASRSENPRASR